MTTFPFKNTINITNVQFDKVIKFEKDIVRFTEIKEINPIPSQSIIYKTITGLGATHSEIVAERDSIIVLPHVSIIKNKQEDYCESHKTLAVYGDIKPFDIYNYIMNTDFKYAKFLTTPQGLNKIISVVNTCEGIDYRKIFFLLIDECQKLIQDSHYRQDMLDLMDHFFQFENKAMISATVIPPSDPRFVEQQFRNIKVTPNFDCEVCRKLYIPKVEVVHSNGIVNSLHAYLKENANDNYCIFYNSIEGIKSLLIQFDINNDYQIFCSEESSDILKLANEPNAKSQIGKLKKYNFFTKSFFNGLDIILENKPNIIIITDYGFRSHTILDPYTDILQIIGRIRKKKDRSDGYQKVTHINIVKGDKNFNTSISENDAILKVQDSKLLYEQLQDLQHATGNQNLQMLFNQALSTVKPYHNLLMNGRFSYFLYDNYMDNLRVRNYYRSDFALHTAYLNTQLYKVNNRRQDYLKSQLIKFTTLIVRYSKEMNRLMADALLNLEQYKSTDVYYEQQFKIAKLSFLIYDAFTRMGYQSMERLSFNKRKIELELLKLDVACGRNSFPVINLMHSTFHLNKPYSCNYVKEKLQSLYNDLNIKYVAKSTDLEHYFEIKRCKRKDKRCYILMSYKQYPVKQIKHI